MFKNLQPLILALLVAHSIAVNIPTWPPVEEVCSLLDTLDGELVLPGNPKYDELREMENTHYTNTPGMIFLAGSEGDVRQALALAIKYNLQPTVSSSGHDLVGRSTANNSIHIDMSSMKGITINEDDPDSETGVSAIMETGNDWERVYEEVDKVEKVMVGGSCPTVALGGFLMGGGLSPIGRYLGLGVDSIMGINMITADNRVIYVDSQGIHPIDPPSDNMDPDPELFWALQGGGGGTYGIVTSFKVKLHDPPTGITVLAIYTPMHHPTCGDIGAEVTETINNWIIDHQEDRKIGGYFSFGNSDAGSVIFSPVYFGSFEEAWPSFQSLYNYKPECLIRGIFNYSTFLEYKQNSPPEVLGFPFYSLNHIMHEKDLTDEVFLQTFTEDIFSYDVNIGCGGTLIGGKFEDVPENSTSVSPYLRSGLASMYCTTSWETDDEADDHIAKLQLFGEKFYQHGEGMYFSEPDYYVENWKTEFWGSMENYDRLLAVKETWDPDHVFWCHKCVGSDLKPPPSDTWPSGDRVTDDMCNGQHVVKKPKHNT